MLKKLWEWIKGVFGSKEPQVKIPDPENDRKKEDAAIGIELITLEDGELINRGDTGPKVKAVQQHVTRHGFRVAVDEHFGIETEKAVKAFQNAKGLEVDGRVGPVTLAALQGFSPTNPDIPTPGPVTPPETREQAIREELVSFWMADERQRETHGKNRSPMIDEVNKNMAYLGAPYCISGLLWRGVRRLCLKYNLKNPVTMTAGVLDFWNRAPQKYRKLPGTLGEAGDIGNLKNRSNDGFGHSFGLRLKDVSTKAQRTIEYNTDLSGSRNGDGVYTGTRTQAGTTTKLFLGYVDVVQWILDANPGFLGTKPETPKPIEPKPPTIKVSNLYREAQGNRGVPKAAFVDELFSIFQKLPDSAFEESAAADIYATIARTLGPWKSITHRRAAGFEAMVALAGRESSWNWNEGRDMNAGNTSPETEEAGAFQTSCDARNWHPKAKALMTGITCREYLTKAKSDHEFTTHYTWYVLRGTNRHHGPVARGEILPYLNQSRVATLTKLFEQSR